MFEAVAIALSLILVVAILSYAWLGPRGTDRSAPPPKVHEGKWLHFEHGYDFHTMPAWIVVLRRNAVVIGTVRWQPSLRWYGFAAAASMEDVLLPSDVLDELADFVRERTEAVR